MTWFEGWGAQVLFHIVHLHIQIPNNNTPLPTFQVRLKHHDTITVSRLLHSGNLNSVHLFMAHSAYSQSTLKNSAFTKPMAFHWWQQNSSALLCFLSVLSVSETSKLIADPSSTRGRCQATDSSSACLRWPWNAGFCLSLTRSSCGYLLASPSLCIWPLSSDVCISPLSFHSTHPLLISAICIDLLAISKKTKFIIALDFISIGINFWSIPSLLSGPCSDIASSRGFLWTYYYSFLYPSFSS